MSEEKDHDWSAWGGGVQLTLNEDYYEECDFYTLEDMLHEMYEAREVVGYAIEAVEEANATYRNAMEQEGIYNATHNGEAELTEAIERISKSIDRVIARMVVAEDEKEW